MAITSMSGETEGTKPIVAPFSERITAHASERGADTTLQLLDAVESLVLEGPTLAKYGHSGIHVRREQVGGPVFIRHAFDDIDLDVVSARHGGDGVDVRGERRQAGVATTWMSG